MMKSNPEMLAEATQDFDDKRWEIRRSKVYEDGLTQWFLPFPFTTERWKNVPGPTEEQLAAATKKQQELGLDGSK